MSSNLSPRYGHEELVTRYGHAGLDLIAVN